MQLDNILLELRDIFECYIKDFRWGFVDDIYFILLREGQFFLGCVGEIFLCFVNSDVVVGDICGIGFEIICYIGD